MHDLSIITLTRDHPDYIERLSDCLDAQWWINALKVQRILVNNGPRKSLKEWDAGTRAGIKRGWIVIEPGYNTSFSEGNNLGVRAADGEFLLLLNDDMAPERVFLASLWASRDRANLIGALTLNKDGTVNHAGTCLWPSSHHIGQNELRAKYECNKLMKCDAITFASAFMRADYYRALGGLDERYIYGWEDTDFSCRVLDAGGLVACCMNAIAIHDECGTRVRGDGGYSQNNFDAFTSTWPKERVKALLEKYWNGREFGRLAPIA
jgi:GT2 family glycosyltransferase